MISASSSEISRHQRSSQRSLNQRFQFLAGIVVQHIDVQFALALTVRQGEVAAAQVANDGGDGIALLVEQVELGMQLVAQKELDDSACASELLAQAAQTFLIGIGWCAHRAIAGGTPAPCAA